jgi:hypothetical protein
VNDPVNKWDYLGMAAIRWGSGTSEKSCCGGADVTKALQDVLFKIERDFWRLPKDDKERKKRSLPEYAPTQAKRCRALYGLDSLWGAWDITELGGLGQTGTWIWESKKWRPPQEGGPCARTVVLGGKCYRAAAVNYAMWGKVNALCNGAFYSDAGFLLRMIMPDINMLAGSHYSLERALSAVTLWKTRYLWAQLGAAREFTRYGFEGGGSPSCSLDHWRVLFNI